MEKQNLKEKIKMQAVRCRDLGASILRKCREYILGVFSRLHLHNKIRPLSDILVKRKKSFIVGAAVAIVLVVGGIFLYSLQADITSWLKKENPTFAAIRKAELAATG